MPDRSTFASIADLRRETFAKDHATRDDFVRALEWSGADSVEFRQYLGEVAVDLFVDQADPPNYVSIEAADWLVAQLRAHPISVAAKIRVLTQVMTYAVSLPSSLSDYALDEIETAIVKGRPDRPAGRIDSDDVEALRRALYAADVGSSLHVTRPEAERLFRIAHACAGQKVDPGFDELFAQAVGNHLLAIAFRGAAPIADELALEKFENAPDEGVGGFLRGMLGVALPKAGDLEDPLQRDEALWRAKNDEDARARADSEKIDQDEIIWLFAHLTRRGELTSAEKKLLEFLHREVAAPPRGLVDLFERAGV
jgi:hypothetical protein